MLAWTIYISFLGVAVLMLLPRGDARLARIVALLTAIAGFVVALAGVIRSEPGKLEAITTRLGFPRYGLIELLLNALNNFRNQWWREKLSGIEIMADIAKNPWASDGSAGDH